MPNLSGSYPGEQFLQTKFGSGQPIVENFLYEQDQNILFGRQKSGKSILALQLLCALTSGEPFLGYLKVAKPLDVVYIQAEGKPEDTQSNLNNMMKSLDCDPSKFLIIYYPGIYLNDKYGYKLVTDQIDEWRNPSVIIADPLYMFMKGDMKDDQSSRECVLSFRKLLDKYNSTHLILHHAHRPSKTRDGFLSEEGVQNIFGSFVWSAFPDNVFYMERTSKNRHRLVCDTQRMGRSIDNINLEMIEPSPLYFRCTDSTSSQDKKQLIHDYISKHTNGSQIEEIGTLFSIERRSVMNYLHELKGEGKIVNISPRGVKGLYKTTH